MPLVAAGGCERPHRTARGFRTPRVVSFGPNGCPAGTMPPGACSLVLVLMLGTVRVPIALGVRCPPSFILAGRMVIPFRLGSALAHVARVPATFPACGHRELDPHATRGAGPHGGFHGVPFEVRFQCE